MSLRLAAAAFLEVAFVVPSVVVVVVVETGTKTKTPITRTGRMAPTVGPSEAESDSPVEEEAFSEVEVFSESLLTWVAS